jgi:hypothetical protein
MALAFMFANSAAAQCTANTCPLGLNTNSRGQIGNGLPLPITGRQPLGVPGTIATGPPGTPGTGVATVIYDAGDRVAPKYHPTNPIPNVFQQSPSPGTPANNPRSLIFPPGQFRVPPIAAPPNSKLAKVPVFTLNPAVFQVNTSLLISNPRVGDPSPVLAAGGRTGPATLTWCPGTPVTPITSTGFNPGCFSPSVNGTGGPTLFNGLARYVATKNQFGGPGTGKTTGMNAGPACTAGGCSVNGPRVVGTANATVYHNVNGLTGGKLPCTGTALCQMAVSVPVPITNGVFGATLGKQVVNPQGLTLSAIRTGTIGANGTILGIGAVVPSGGPFLNGAWPQQGVTSVGLPATTGMLTISVTGQAGPVPEIFKRSGYDGRNAAGSGLLSLVGGALSNRTFSGPNANRTWITYWLPEPGALVAGTSALMMLGGCHWLVRRRR